MQWVKRHHVITAVLASLALLLSVMTVGEPLGRQQVRADTVSVSVASGSLGSQELKELRATTREIPGANGEVAILLAPTRVGDARGNGAGWSLTLAASLSSPGVRDFPAQHAIIGVVPTPTVRKISGRKPPETYGGMLDGRGMTMAVANPGRGMGVYELQPVLDIARPSDLPHSAVLEATLTQTFISVY